MEEAGETVPLLLDSKRSAAGKQAKAGGSALLLLGVVVGAVCVGVWLASSGTAATPASPQQQLADLQTRIAAKAGSQCNITQNTIIGAGSIEIVKNATLDQCCDLCWTVESCVAFTLATDSNTCYLKNNTSPGGTHEDHVSGVVGAHQGWSRACVNGVGEDLPFCDSSLSRGQRLDDLVQRIFLNESGGQLTARSSDAIPRLGIPTYYWGTNAIHGLQQLDCFPNGQCPTSFPAPCSLAATFNMTHVGVMANIIGREMRAYFNTDNHISLDSWSPTLNVNRDPRWGRNVESPGEDPKMCGSFATAYTHGIQTGTIVPDNIDATPSTAAVSLPHDDDQVFQAAVTLKHWLAYSLEAYPVAPYYYTRYNYSANVSEFDLQDTYLVGWKKAIQESNPKGVMCSYNFLNNQPTCGTPAITKMLHDMGFDGYITSDTDAVRCIYNTHHFVPNITQAVKLGLEGGCDINSGWTYRKYVEPAVQNQEVSQDAVRAALRNAYETRFKVGLFDPASKDPWSNIDVKEVGQQSSQDASLRAARDGMVLLKNSAVSNARGATDGGPLLPLKKGTKLGLIGRVINSGEALLGNYNGPICPDKTYSCVPTLFQQIQKVNSGGDTVGFDDVNDIDGAVKVAAASDVVVLVIDNADDGGGEGLDRITIGLDDAQQALATAVADSQKPIVLVMVNGGAISIDLLMHAVDAIVEAFMPGVHGAQAVAETLFGDNNPGGKLPVTIFPSHYISQVDFLNMSMTAGAGRTYRYYTGQPLFPFGFGLSYTSFALSWPTSSPPVLTAPVSTTPAPLSLSVRVRNTGQRAGDEVVFGFVSCCDDGAPKSLQGAPVAVKQLFAFQRVRLQPGEERDVVLELGAHDQTMVDVHGHRGMHAGRYRVVVSRGHGDELEAQMVLTPTVDGQEVAVVERFHKWW